MSQASKNKDDINKKEDTNEEILSFSLNDYKYFEYSQIDNQYEEESALEDMNFEWNPLNEDFAFSYKKIGILVCDVFIINIIIFLNIIEIIIN